MNTALACEPLCEAGVVGVTADVGVAFKEGAVLWDSIDS